MALWYVFPLESLTVNVSPEAPALMTTPIQLPMVLLEGNASEEEVVVPPSFPALWTKVIAVPCVTVKATLLLANPPVVTTTLPVVAVAGTGVTMVVALQLLGVA